MNSISQSRLRSVDIAKGIAIICIILGHLHEDSINRVVYTFHVPVFFLITGYFINEGMPAGQFIKRKFRTLVVPYFIISLAIIMLSVFQSLLVNRNILTTVLYWTGAALYASGSDHSTLFFEIHEIGAIWFLWATFFAGVIVKLLLKKNYIVQILGISVAFLTGYLTSRYLFWFPLSIQAGLCASLYVYIGYCFRKTQETFRRLPIGVKITGIILAALVWISFIRNFQSFWLVSCDFGRGFTDIVSSLSACLVVFVISYLIDRYLKIPALILSNIGKCSLLVLFVHLIELNFVHWPNLVDQIVPPENHVLNLMVIILYKLALDIGIGLMMSNISFIRRAFAMKTAPKAKAL